MADSADNSTKTELYFPVTTTELARVLLTGILVGVLVGLLTELIARFFIEPVFCRSADSFTICANGGTVAFNAALVVVGMAAVAVLARLAVFRPLLVALGAAASLWGINAYMAGLSWYEYGFWLMLLFGVAYLLFYWLLRLSNFVIALICWLVAIVLIRLLLLL